MVGAREAGAPERPAALRGQLRQHRLHERRVGPMAVPPGRRRERLPRPGCAGGGAGDRAGGAPEPPGVGCVHRWDAGPFQAAAGQARAPSAQDSRTRAQGDQRPLLPRTRVGEGGGAPGRGPSAPPPWRGPRTRGRGRGRHWPGAVPPALRVTHLRRVRPQVDGHGVVGPRLEELGVLERIDVELPTSEPVRVPRHWARRLDAELVRLGELPKTVFHPEATEEALVRSGAITPLRRPSISRRAPRDLPPDGPPAP